MPQPQTVRGPGRKIPKVFLHRLADRLESFESSGLFDSMDAHAFGCAVIDRGKNGHIALRFRKGGCRIRAPHVIRRHGHDRPLVRVGGSWLRLPRWGKQLMLPQQAQDAILASAHALLSQAGPDLSIALSGEDRGRQQLANLGNELFIGPHFRAALLRTLWMLHPATSGVETGPRQVPHRGYSRHTIRLVAGRRNGAAHGFDFQKAKGRPSSRRAIFSRSNSFSTLMLATADFNRRFSSSSTSTSRLFKIASPPAKKRSRHSVRVAAVTRYFREVLFVANTEAGYNGAQERYGRAIKPDGGGTPK